MVFLQWETPIASQWPNSRSWCFPWKPWFSNAQSFQMWLYWECEELVGKITDIRCFQQGTHRLMTVEIKNTLPWDQKTHLKIAPRAPSPQRFEKVFHDTEISPTPIHELECVIAFSCSPLSVIPTNCTQSVTNGSSIDTDAIGILNYMRDGHLIAIKIDKSIPGQWLDSEAQTPFRLWCHSTKPSAAKR